MLRRHAGGLRGILSCNRSEAADLRALTPSKQQLILRASLIV